MAQVILFGGGDGGGLIITSSGIRPIPPFEPKLRLKLKGLSALVNGLGTLGKKPTRETKDMATLINRMSNLIVAEVSSIVGTLGSGHSLIYQDEDGGFSCGSTGRMPIPIPWPPQRPLTKSELLATGIFDQEMMDFVALISEKKIEIQKVLENPMHYAKELGVNLSERSASEMQKLALSGIADRNDSVEKEIIQFFHSVLEDKRYLEIWSKCPNEVAGNLRIKLSDKALDRIIAGNTSSFIDLDPAINPIAAALFATIIILLIPIYESVDY